MFLFSFLKFATNDVVYLFGNSKKVIIALICFVFIMFGLLIPCDLSLFFFFHSIFSKQLSYSFGCQYLLGRKRLY